MTNTTRPAPFFVSDHMALDFLSTRTAPWGKEIEWLSSGTDLLDWLEAAEAISGDQKKALSAQFSTAELEAACHSARSLREWFRGFISSYAGNELTEFDLAELQPINQILAQSSQYSQVSFTGEGSHVQLTTFIHWRSHVDLLLPVANAIADLVCNQNFKYIKNCEGPTCNLFYLDETKNHTRRWCTMSVCGNRAKAAAFRARKKQSS